MSFREEDREKENNSSRGLGLGLAAAAAIGVGVGAALYYFINKRTETPTSEGSTTRGWTCESPQTFIQNEEVQHDSDDSYTTICEQSTTDTSMYEDSFSCKCTYNSDDISDDSDSESQDSESSTVSGSSDDEDDSDSDEGYDLVEATSASETDESEFSEWDVTASTDYPSFEPPMSRSYLENYARSLMSQKKNKRNNANNPRSAEVFRERSWTLEECSICFDVILRDQEVMALPCTHNFHTKCILPWLQEQQTCPNCRKSID